MTTDTVTGSRTAGGLLAAGVAAGPLYVAIALLQYLFRDGLDMGRHVLSLASNGDRGWVQIASFAMTGALTIAGAFGLRRVLHPGRGGTWGPLLVGAYGVGLVGAGLFLADPAQGFPPGTPDGPPATVSGHGLTHLTFASLGFVALIVACFVLSRRFRAAGRPGWRAYSLVTGVVLIITQIALVAAPGAAVNVAYVLTALHASVWVTVVSAVIRSGGVR